MPEFNNIPDGVTAVGLAAAENMLNTRLVSVAYRGEYNAYTFTYDVGGQLVDARVAYNHVTVESILQQIPLTFSTAEMVLDSEDATLPLPPVEKKPTKRGKK